MKKLIIITLTIIFSNASLSLAGQFKSRWGVVIGVNPVNVTSNYQEPIQGLYVKNSDIEIPITLPTWQLED